MRTILTKEPIESMLQIEKSGDGNNALHVVTFRPVSYSHPVEFFIRGEWEMHAFKSLISKI